MQLPVTRLVFLLIPRGSQRKRTGVGYVAPRIVGNISRLNHHPPSAVRDRFVRFLPLFRHSFSSESDFPTDRKGRDGNRRRSLNRKRVPRDDGDDGGRLSMVAPISAAGRI